jgi:hypothetical protein
MSAVTQTIPNYIFGISQQPDFLKQPGQVVDSINATPDVTAGLVKRPGSRFIQNVNDNDDGRWFSYYRTPEEQYLGHIQTNGFVRFWNVTDGAACTVTQINDAAGNPVTATSTTANYLQHTLREDIQTCTINDYTFLTNRGTVLDLQGVRRFRQSPRLLGSPLADNGQITRANPPIQAEAGILVIAPVTTSGPSTANDADTQNEPTTLTQMNVPADLDREAVPTGLMVDLCIEEVTLENDQDDRTTENHVISCGFASTLAITTPGASLQFEEDDGTIETSGDFVNVTVSVTDPDMTRAVRDVDKLSVNFTLTNGVITACTLNRPGFCYSDGATFTIDGLTVAGSNPVTAGHLITRNERANARGTNYQNGDVFTVDNIDGELIGFDGPIFQIVDSTFGTPYRPCGWLEVKVVSYGREYRVDLKNEDNELLAALVVDTTADATTQLGARADILEPLAKLIREARPNGSEAISVTNEVYGFQTEIIGNGIYISWTEDFNISVSDAQILGCFTDEINNVERLPFQCKDGYVVKIANTADENDDFYSEFRGNLRADGEGAWQEVAQPDIQTTFDAATMPHVIISEAPNEFVVQQAAYTKREVGDEGTNPTPSFVDVGVVNNIVLFRSRVCFLSGENLAATQTGEIDPMDFWSTSALTTLPTDPLDVSAASKKPAILYDAIEVNTGLICFSENQQFLLATDAETLSQETAKFNSISYFQYDRNNPPISLGTSVGFVDNNGANFRFFEIFNFSIESEPTLTEPSIPVSRLTSDNVSYIADSRESTIVLFANDGPEDDTSIVWGYRYFQDGDTRRQSAWFKWDLPGRILYHAIMADVYYAVVRYQTGLDANNNPVFSNQLVEWDVKRSDETNELLLDNTLYRIHLDNRVLIPNADLTYNAATDTTTFNMPQVNSEDAIVRFNRNIWAYCVITGAPQQGNIQLVTWNGNVGSVPGNWTSNLPNYNLQIGYKFQYKVVIPTFYALTSREPVQYDSRSSLVVHRYRISAGRTGVFESTLSVPGKNDYTEVFEANIMNAYRANTPILVPEWTQYIPVYERNTSVDITLTSEHPSPFSLFSIAWEGDWNNRYYRSV